MRFEARTSTFYKTMLEIVYNEIITVSLNYLFQTGGLYKTYTQKLAQYSFLS